MQVNVAFGAVSLSSLPTYHAAESGNDAYFEDVDVTDNNGAAQAVTSGGLVNVTPSNPYGVAEVKVTVSKTASDTSSYSVAELIGLLSTADLAKVITISIETPAPGSGESNHARVYKAAPTTGSNGYATQDLSVNLTFKASTRTWELSGTGYTLGQPSTAEGTGTIRFYYSAQNALTEVETSSNHANDNIKANVSVA